MNGKLLLETKNLNKTYGKGDGRTKALTDVSLKLYEGELLVISGNSGCGKSTLLNLIGGMDRADSGEIIIDGKDVCGFNEKELTLYRKQCVGFVFQSFNLIQELTVRENVELTSSFKNKDDVKKVLKSLGISEQSSKYPAQLSGGQQQRVAIARALSKDSRFLLCDEPTGSLDYESGKLILTELEKLCRKQGKTIVIVTHTREIGNMADRVIHMKNGSIVGEETNSAPCKAADIQW